MFLYYTADGLLVIRPQDNPHQIVNAMLETGYSEEFCISDNFEPEFIARLMEAGFLVMSARFPVFEDAAFDEFFILLPKLHLTRSALFFDNLHIKKSVKRYLNRFELRFDGLRPDHINNYVVGETNSLPTQPKVDTDFDYIVDRCLAVHGEDWLTPPLVAAIREIRKNKLHGGNPLSAPRVYPASFALYQDEKLVAGEFGIVSGRVYTSYSGYYDVANAGTVQLILASRFLQENGFAFFDLGMPLDYKTDLGAVNISPQEFVALFRAAQMNTAKKSLIFSNFPIDW